MPLENLQIRRVCLHEVYRRADDQTLVPPTYGSGLLNLDQRAMGAFLSRVHSAFKADAKCMVMRIERAGPGSATECGDGLLRASDAAFVSDSRAFADLLADAQRARTVPGGVVAVFDGTVGNPAQPFFGIMKAELHEGFLKSNNLQATFIENLFLTPKTKLYKIGIFARRPNTTGLENGYVPTVFDSQLTASKREGAALYFHGHFLGLEIPEDAAHQVRKFFEHTREFIAAAPMPEDQKVDLYNGLYSYLKLDQRPTIQVGEFADTYMTEDLGDDYREQMRRRGFAEQAIDKDLSEVAGRLRLRRLRFPRRIALSGPPDAIDDLVTIDSIRGEAGNTWTRITIKGPIEGQE